MATDASELGDRLNTFLDVLADGARRVPNGLLASEPDLAETIRRLRALDNAPTADPHFADRLLGDLMRAETAHEHSIFPRNLPRNASPDDSPAARARLFGPRASRLQAQVATAALLLLAVVSTILVFGPGRAWRPHLAPALLPAMPVTPQASGIATRRLLEVVIPTQHDGEVWVEIDRYTMPSATELGGNLHDARAPEVIYVADGAIEVHAGDTQPVRVIRGGGADAEEALAGEGSTTLTAGDGLVIPEGGTARFMNVAAEPAVVLLLLVPTTVDLPESDKVAYERLGGSMWTVSPPLSLTLEEATLAPNAALPGVDAPNAERVVALVDRERMEDARVGANGALRNAGDEPLAAYVLTVTSGGLGS